MEKGAREKVGPALESRSTESGHLLEDMEVVRVFNEEDLERKEVEVERVEGGKEFLADRKEAPTEE